MAALLHDRVKMAAGEDECVITSDVVTFKHFPRSDVCAYEKSSVFRWFVFVYRFRIIDEKAFIFA